MRAMVLSLLALILSGCVTTEPGQSLPSQTAEAEPPRPTSPEMKKKIAEYFKQSLKDPYSIRDAEITDTAGVEFVGLLTGGNKPVICARLNAKNSFGGYTGIKEYGFVIEGDRIVNAGPIGGPGLGSGCRYRKWVPFVELSSTSAR